MDDETKAATAARIMRANAMDWRNGRVGPSAHDWSPELLALVGLADNGDRRAARGMLGIVAGWLEARQPIPEPVASFLAEAFRKVADNASADAALKIRRGGRTEHDDAPRDARVVAVVEEIHAQRHPYKGRQGVAGAYEIAAKRLHLSPSRVKAIHEEGRRKRRAAEAFARGNASATQFKIILDQATRLLSRKPPFAPPSKSGAD